MEQRIKGFTLVELVMVIVIASILAVYVLMNNTPSKRLFDVSTVTEQLRRDIRYTQSLALNLNASYMITINSTSYTITPNPPTGAYSFSLPSGITLSPVTSITFDNTGTPSSAPTITVSGGAGAGSQTLTVSPETGFVNG